MRDVLIISYNVLVSSHPKNRAEQNTGAHDAAAARFAEGLLMDLLEPRWLGYQKSVEKTWLV